jgi:hypothetical protein
MIVVSLGVADFTEPELRQEILKLQRRAQKLAALFRPRAGSCQPPVNRGVRESVLWNDRIRTTWQEFPAPGLAAADLFTVEGGPRRADALRRRPRH